MDILFLGQRSSRHGLPNHGNGTAQGRLDNPLPGALDFLFGAADKENAVDVLPPATVPFLVGISALRHHVRVHAFDKGVITELISVQLCTFSTSPCIS